MRSMQATATGHLDTQKLESILPLGEAVVVPTEHVLAELPLVKTPAGPKIELEIYCCLVA